MMSKEEKSIQFGQEVQKFHSILHPISTLLNSVEIEEFIGKFADISIYRIYVDNYIIGFTMNFSTKVIECWVNEEVIGYNVEERSNLVSLLSKFYDKVSLNSHV